MSGSELTQLLDQVEGAIRDFSEELVHQLARRDELEFEKEVKNSFITVLIEVQNKQKEQRELMKKRRKEKGLSLQSSRIEKGNQMPLKVCEQPSWKTGNLSLEPQPSKVPTPTLRWTLNYLLSISSGRNLVTGSGVRRCHPQKAPSLTGLCEDTLCSRLGLGK
jgi:hypothetical protein